MLINSSELVWRVDTLARSIVHALYIAPPGAAASISNDAHMQRENDLKKERWWIWREKKITEMRHRRRSYSIIHQRDYIHVSFPIYKSCLRDCTEHRGIARVLAFISSSVRCTHFGAQRQRTDDARVAELLSTTLCSSASSEISHQRAPSISAGFTMLML